MKAIVKNATATLTLDPSVPAPYGLRRACENSALSGPFNLAPPSDATSISTFVWADQPVQSATTANFTYGEYIDSSGDICSNIKNTKTTSIQVLPLQTSMTLPGSALGVGNTVTGTVSLNARPHYVTFVRISVDNPTVGHLVTTGYSSIESGTTVLAFMINSALPYPESHLLSQSFTFVADRPGTTTITAQTSMSGLLYGTPVTSQVTVSGSGEDLGPQCHECTFGSPINGTNGNTYLSSTDISYPGLAGGLRLERTWNSLFKTESEFEFGWLGRGWMSTYDEILTFVQPGKARYYRADGSSVYFTFNSSTQTYDLTSPLDADLTLSYDAGAAEYTVRGKNGTKHVFNYDGFPLRFADSNGNTTTLTYDAEGLLSVITDPAGRHLYFNYNDPYGNTVVTNVNTDASQSWYFDHDANGNLTKVTKPDGSIVQYAYDSSDLLYRASDDISTLESHTYDQYRRGTSSYRAGSVEYVSVNYPSAGGSAIISDSTSNQTTATFTYAAGHRLVTGVTGPGCATCLAHGTESFAYDANGRRLSTTDELGRTSNFAYDTAGNLQQVSRAIGSDTQAWNYTYNSFGEVLTATDPLGNVTPNTYDANGNLLSSRAPSPDGIAAGPLTAFTYNSKGQLLTVTDPRSKVTTLTYTPAGLIATVKDPLNNITTFEYDLRGNRTAVVDALNNRTTFVYDAMNRPTSTIYPDASHIDNTYDSRGRLRSVIDQNGHSTSYTFDDADRLTQVTDALSNHTYYEYDNENNLTRITDAAGRHTDYSYDSKRRLTATTFPSGLQETYEYDAVGNLTAKTDRNGQRIAYSYDSVDRLTGKSYPDSTSVAFTYDLANRLTQAVDPTGTYGFTFDRMGRLTQTSTAYSFMPSRTFVVKSEYDAASNRTKMTDAENTATTYTYDDDNRFASINNGLLFSFAYDALGRRTTLTRPHTRTYRDTSYTYDNLSRLTRISHVGPGGNAQFTYTYDSAGNRATAGYQDAVNLIGTYNEQYSYTYDATNQLVSTAYTTDRLGSGTRSYAYDAVGNRSSGVPTGAFDNSNHLTMLPNGGAITYDNNGSELQKTTIDSYYGTKTRRYQWDYENHLVLLTKTDNSTVDFKYDPFGRRIKRGSDVFVYDGDNIIGDYSIANGTIGLSGTNLFGSGVDEVLLSHNMRVYPDALGSPRAEQLANPFTYHGMQFSYDDWGNQTRYSDPYGDYSMLAGDQRYTGRDLDADSTYLGDQAGLIYYRARYYDPTLGRFISEDPIRFNSGDPNFYRYVGNNPINSTDPTGLAQCTYSISLHTLICQPNGAGYNPSIIGPNAAGAVQVGPIGVVSGNGNCANNTSTACLNSVYRNNDSNSGGPIPPGDYALTYMYDKYWNDGHDRFDIAQLPFDLLHRAWRWGMHRRKAFELHRGTITHGCINVDKDNPGAMSQYDDLKLLLLQEQFNGGNTMHVIP